MTTQPPTLSEFYKGLPFCQLSGQLTTPNNPGVYILSVPGTVLYVGEGADLLNRLTKQGHERRSGINKLWSNAIVKWYASDECADSRFRDRLESAVITELAPLLNTPHHACEQVTVGLPPKVSDRLRSQAWRRGLPLPIWAGMVLGAQSEFGVDGRLY